MMNYLSFIKKRRIYRNISFVVILLALVIPNKGKFRYEYQKGRPWLYESLVAPIDFPVLKTVAELRKEREELSSSVVPYYNYKEGVDDEQIKLISSNLVLPEDDSIITSYLYSSIKNIYSKGVIDEMPDTLYSKGVVAIVKYGKPTLHPLRNLFTPGEASAQLKKMMSDKFPGADELILRALPSQSLPVNLFFDNNMTQLVLKNQIADISPTKGVIYTGQLIISNGESVTAESEQLLDSFKAEYELSMGFSGSFLLLKLGYALIIMLIILILIVVIYYLDREILKEPNRFNFILLQFILVVIATVVVMDTGQEYLMVFPFSVIALYLTSLYYSKIVIPVYMTIMLPVVFIATGGFELYFLNIVSGTAVFYTFQYLDRGWRQFVNSLFVFVTLSLTYLTLRMVEDGSLESVTRLTFIYFAWNSVLIIAAYPLLYLFEKIFGLLSNSRLRDLSDTTTTLLSSLAEKAPGTFHHSLQVANLSESAAREIGAYALLARVGALYHDIGKMSNPPFFIENLPAGESSLHSDLPGEESAKIIIQHVDEGFLIARKARLPQMVIDFILTHHGKTQVGYFYNKYVNSGGDPANIAQFTYKGELPKTKEQVIVMMADAVEASSRSLKDHSRESVCALVDRMIDERIAEKQLIDADISIKEIYAIKEVFKQRLGQVYHSRLKYPERKKGVKIKPV